VSDVRLSVVIPMAGAMWLVQCECGAESTRKSEPEAYEWLVGHPCLLDLGAVE
jgi:hypothetical protein